MRPDLPPDACWTSIFGAPTHRLGSLPERCYTCAVNRIADRGRVMNPGDPAQPTLDALRRMP